MRTDEEDQISERKEITDKMLSKAADTI